MLKALAQTLLRAAVLCRTAEQAMAEPFVKLSIVMHIDLSNSPHAVLPNCALWKSQRCAAGMETLQTDYTPLAPWRLRNGAGSN